MINRILKLFGRMLVSCEGCNKLLLIKIKPGFIQYSCACGCSVSIQEIQ